MNSKRSSLFVLINSLLSGGLLICVIGGFNDFSHPLVILASGWVFLFAILSLLAIRRLINPISVERVASMRRLRWSILVCHTAVVIGWFQWSTYCETQGNPGGAMQTALLQYSVEAPCFGGSQLIDWFCHYVFALHRPIIWRYVDFLILGGAYYSCLPQVTKFGRTNIS